MLSINHNIAGAMPTLSHLECDPNALMSRYRRALIPGGTFFFTVTLADRSSSVLVQQIDLLRDAYKAVQQRHPFETVAICILPEHLHAIWTLPEGDSNFPGRWSVIKSTFSKALSGSELRSPSNIRKREKTIWQRRYWEHVIRNDTDLERHIDYIHFNPVKHTLVTRVCDWPHSSFHRFVARGMLPIDWGGDVKVATGAFGE
jgi:putative transposase